MAAHDDDRGLALPASKRRRALAPDNSARETLFIILTKQDCNNNEQENEEDEELLSDHPSDDEVVREMEDDMKMEELIELESNQNKITLNANQNQIQSAPIAIDFEKIWCKRYVKTSIFEYLAVEDIFTRFILLSKKYCSNVRESYRAWFGQLYQKLGESRPILFLNSKKGVGKNVIYTNVAKAWILAFFDILETSVAKEEIEASKNKFVRLELTQYYLHKGVKWTQNGIDLLPVQIQCIKQQIHRWKKTNDEGM